MTPRQASRAKELIDKQIAMSGQTLDALRNAGLTDDKLIQLDFFFIAPDQKAAQALVAHLEVNNCLDLSYERVGGFLSRRYVVRGRTHPTPITPQVIAEWLPWVVTQGISHDCEFDGWGAEV